MADSTVASLMVGVGMGVVVEVEVEAAGEEENARGLLRGETRAGWRVVDGVRWEGKREGNCVEERRNWGVFRRMVGARC